MFFFPLWKLLGVSLYPWCSKNFLLCALMFLMWMYCFHSFCWTKFRWTFDFSREACMSALINFLKYFLGNFLSCFSPFLCPSFTNPVFYIVTLSTLTLFFGHLSMHYLHFPCIPLSFYLFSAIHGAGLLQISDDLFVHARLKVRHYKIPDTWACVIHGASF